VKYMLLIYENPGTRELFSGEAGKEMMATMEALMAELTESGELIGGQALADPSHSRTVRTHDGVPAVTDGPFVESKEHLGGYIIVDCESIERAVEIARRWPHAEPGGMEVRPIMNETGTEL
jgi:hypothetical protein